MSKKYKQIIEDLEKALQDIESQGISILPLSDAIENLKIHSENIEAIEKNIDAVKAEVITPIKTELEQNRTASKFSIRGFYVGAFGLLVTAISLLYTTFGDPTDKSTLYNISEKTNVGNIESLWNKTDNTNYGTNYKCLSLNKEILIEEYKSKVLLDNGSEKINIEAINIEEERQKEKWYPVSSLIFGIGDRKLGIRGLKEIVEIINNSKIARYNSNKNSITLSENDEFILMNKYRYKIIRIYRTRSHLLKICDNKNAVLIK